MYPAGPRGVRRRVRMAATFGSPAPGGRHLRPVHPAGASPHHHHGTQRAHGEPAGRRRHAGARRHRFPSHRSGRRRHLSRAGTDRRLSYYGPARMEARRRRLRASHRTDDDRYAGGFRHPRRADSEMHRRLGGRRENRRHRSPHQPMGHIARFCAERLDGHALLPVHYSLRPDQTRHFHGAIGLRRFVDRGRRSPDRAFRPRI
jgi:hypothetical protein